MNPNSIDLDNLFPEEETKSPTKTAPIRVGGDDVSNLFPEEKESEIDNLFSDEPYVKELSDEEKKQLLGGDERTFSRGFMRGYEKTPTLEENFGDWLESKYPMGRYDFSGLKLIAPLWGGEGPYISPEEAYGQDFMALTEDERRERIQQLKKDYIAQKYPEFEGQTDRTWGEAVGSLVGGAAGPSSLTPLGRTYKSATALGGITGFAYGASEGLAQEGEINPSTTAMYTGAGVVLGPVVKWAGDKVAAKFADNALKASEKEASSFVEAYQNVIYERMAIGEDTRSAFDYANKTFRVTDDTVQKFVDKAERKIYIPKQEEAQLYIDLVRFNQTGTAPMKSRGRFSSTADEILGVLSTRVKKVSVPIWHRLRKLDYNQHSRLHNINTEVKPFLENLTSLPNDVKQSVDRALLNGNFDGVESAIKASGNREMLGQFNTVKSVLDDIYKEAKESGIDIGFTENYFPRFIKDYDGLKNQLGTEQADVLEELMSAAAKKKGSALTSSEEGDIINKYIRGIPIGVDFKKIGFTQQRKIEEIPEELMQFYASPEESLQHYIRKTINEIEKRKFFGGGYQKNKLGTTNIEDSIGGLIAKEKELGNIDKNRIDELKNLLRVRFNEGEIGTGPGTQLVKDVLYMETLGNPLSAATQIGDTFLATYKNGIKPVIQSFLEKNKIRLDDYGFTEIAEEFASKSGLNKALNFTFKWTGFRGVDRIGKETILNSSLIKYTNQVKDPKKAAQFREKWKVAFGDDVDNLMSDLQTGKVSDDVKMLLWHDLSDMQPVSLSEMPEKYLKMNQGRIMYMLKTFTIKQLDIIRRDVVQQIKTPGSRMEGVKNAAKYMAAFQAGGMTSDAVKSWMSGREYDMEDSVIENFWRMAGIGRYTATKMTEKPVETTAQLALPPVNIWDGMIQDIKDLIVSTYDPEVEVKGKSVKSLPIVGRLLYEHGMGGKEEFAEKKLEEELDAAGFAKGGMLDQSRQLFRRGGYLRTQNRYAEGGSVTDEEADRDPESVSTEGIDTSSSVRPEYLASQAAKNTIAAATFLPGLAADVATGDLGKGIYQSTKAVLTGDEKEYDWTPTTKKMQKTAEDLFGVKDIPAQSTEEEVLGFLADPTLALGGWALKPIKSGKQLYKGLLGEAPNELPGFYSGPVGQVASATKGAGQAAVSAAKTVTNPQRLADVMKLGIPGMTRDVVQRNVDVLNKYAGKKNLTVEEKKAVNTATKVITGQLTYNANLAKQVGYDSPLLNRWTENVNKEITTYNRNNIDLIGDYSNVRNGMTKTDLDTVHEHLGKAWSLKKGEDIQMVVRPTVVKGGAGDFSSDMRKTDKYKTLTEVGQSTRDPKELADNLKNAGMGVKKVEGDDVWVTFSMKSSSYAEGGVNVVGKLNAKTGDFNYVVSDEHDMFGFKPPGGKRLITVTPASQTNIYKMSKVTSKTPKTKPTETPLNLKEVKTDAKARLLEKNAAVPEWQRDIINQILSTRSQITGKDIGRAAVGASVIGKDTDTKEQMDKLKL